MQSGYWVRTKRGNIFDADMVDKYFYHCVGIERACN